MIWNHNPLFLTKTNKLTEAKEDKRHHFIFSECLKTYLLKPTHIKHPIEWHHWRIPVLCFSGYIPLAFMQMLSGCVNHTGGDLEKGG